MTDVQSQPVDGPPFRRPEPSPWSVALTTFLITLGSFALVGPLIGAILGYIYYAHFDINLLEFLQQLGDPIGNEEIKIPLMITQAGATVIGLAVIPPLFWKSMRHRSILELIKGSAVKPITFLLAIGIVFFFLGPNSVIIEWNANIDLPDGAFETWARTTEDQAFELTKFMTTFSNFGEYLFTVVVIAVFAGIGEELVFRGLLQPELQKATGNIHIGIWVSAIFFSAVHLQFYGFVPRVLLGALFGYLYYWSGSLSVAMFAHFMNNFLAVTLMYLGLEDMAGGDAKDPESMPWYTVILFTLLCAVLIYFFQKQFKKTDGVRA